MSFATKTKLWLPVRRDAEPDDLTAENGNELWSTRRPITQRLEPGDTVVLWPGKRDDYDGLDGPEWPVHKVLWNADGIMNLWLALMILDPSDEVKAAYSSRARSGWDLDFVQSKKLWPLDEDGDFENDMHRGGWYQ